MEAVDFRENLRAQLSGQKGNTFSRTITCHQGEEYAQVIAYIKEYSPHNTLEKGVALVVESCLETNQIRISFTNYENNPDAENYLNSSHQKTRDVARGLYEILAHSSEEVVFPDPVFINPDADKNHYTPNKEQSVHWTRAKTIIYATATVVICGWGAEATYWAPNMEFTAVPELARLVFAIPSVFQNAAGGIWGGVELYENLIETRSRYLKALDDGTLSTGKKVFTVIGGGVASIPFVGTKILFKEPETAYTALDYVDIVAIVLMNSFSYALGLKKKFGSSEQPKIQGVTKEENSKLEIFRGRLKALMQEAIKEIDKKQDISELKEALGYRYGEKKLSVQTVEYWLKGILTKNRINAADIFREEGGQVKFCQWLSEIGVYHAWRIIKKFREYLSAPDEGLLNSGIREILKSSRQPVAPIVAADNDLEAAVADGDESTQMDDRSPSSYRTSELITLLKTVRNATAGYQETMRAHLIDEAKDANNYRFIDIFQQLVEVLTEQKGVKMLTEFLSMAQTNKFKETGLPSTSHDILVGVVRIINLTGASTFIYGAYTSVSPIGKEIDELTGVPLFEYVFFAVMAAILFNSLFVLIKDVAEDLGEAFYEVLAASNKWQMLKEKANIVPYLPTASYLSTAFSAIGGGLSWVTQYLLANKMVDFISANIFEVPIYFRIPFVGACILLSVDFNAYGTQAGVMKPALLIYSAFLSRDQLVREKAQLVWRSAEKLVAFVGRMTQGNLVRILDLIKDEPAIFEKLTRGILTPPEMDQLLAKVNEQERAEVANAKKSCCNRYCFCCGDRPKGNQEDPRRDEGRRQANSAEGATEASGLLATTLK